MHILHEFQAEESKLEELELQEFEALERQVMNELNGIDLPEMSSPTFAHPQSCNELHADGASAEDMQSPWNEPTPSPLATVLKPTEHVHEESIPRTTDMFADEVRESPSLHSVHQVSSTLMQMLPQNEVADLAMAEEVTMQSEDVTTECASLQPDTDFQSHRHKSQDYLGQFY